MAECTNITDSNTNFYIQPLEPSFWTYPTNSYNYVIGEDKIKKAISIIQFLRKNKKIKIDSIDNFIELIKEISEIL